MRVVHWFPNFLAGGGVANSVLALANAQAAAGADVWIASLDRDSAIYGRQPLVGVRTATWPGGRSLGAGGLRLHLLDRASSRSLRELQPDVVHVHAEFNPDNWWAPRVWRAPLVLSPHGAFHQAVLQRGARSKRLYRALASPLLYRRVARFHGLSPAELADLETALPRASAYCVPQGPSPAVAAALGGIDGTPPGRRAGPARLMFVGRIDVEVKGLDVLVEAFARAVAGDRQATLTLVGPDWQGGTAPLRELARRLGVADLIDMRGRVDADEVTRLLLDCDVYVQLSRNEASPLSVNDALALGKPAIVSDRIGTVSSDEIARLPHIRIVPPTVDAAAAAIGDALADLDALREAARAAHGTVREYLSWERAARRHLDEYVALPRG